MAIPPDEPGRRNQALILGAIMGSLALLLVGSVLVLLNLSGKTEAENPNNAQIMPPADRPLKIAVPSGKEEPPTPGKAVPDKKDAPLQDQAEFMGTRARGRRFCIIADASNSMRGAPLAQLKKEIVKTLENLSPSSHFYVIFFNATDIPMPYPGWLAADKENVDKVRPWIEGMTTVGKTQPASSFQRAFKLQPKPDAIFFMTDGLIPAKTPALVQRLNDTPPRIVIHTIMFSKRNAPEARILPAEAQLRAIADQAGGTYRHVKGGL